MYYNVATARPLNFPHSPVPGQKRKQQPAPSTAITASEKVLYLVSIIICVSLSLVVLARYCTLTELNVSAQQTEMEIKKIKQENEVLEIEKRSLASSENVKQFAEARGLKLKAPQILPFQP